MQRTRPPASFAPQIAGAWAVFRRHMDSMPPRPAPTFRQTRTWIATSKAREAAEAALGAELVAAAYPGAPLIDKVDFQAIGAYAADPLYLLEGEGIMETILWQSGARSAVAYLHEAPDPETGTISWY